MGEEEEATALQIHQVFFNLFPFFVHQTYHVKKKILDTFMQYRRISRQPDRTVAFYIPVVIV